MALIVRWIASAAAVAAAVYLLPGIRLEGGIGALFAVALVLGLVNALLRPLLRWLACGVIVMTLGLFLLVINAVLLLLAAWISRTLGIAFHVDGFTDAILASLIISAVSFVLSIVLPGRRARR
jgi:putative membrane protein